MVKNDVAVIIQCAELRADGCVRHRCYTFHCTIGEVHGLELLAYGEAQVVAIGRPIRATTDAFGAGNRIESRSVEGSDPDPAALLVVDEQRELAPSSDGTGIDVPEMSMNVARVISVDGR